MPKTKPSYHEDDEREYIAIPSIAEMASATSYQELKEWSMYVHVTDMFIPTPVVRATKGDTHGED